MKFLLFFILLISTSIYSKEINKLHIVRESINYMQPALTSIEADSIAYSVIKYADEYGLDWKIMTAILAQESSFKKDPQKCLIKKRKCKDLGMAQINLDTWEDELELDKVKLLKDIDYNISVMAKILSILKEKHGHEKKWYTRYHSGTPFLRKIYANFIYHKWMKIENYSNGFNNGLLITLKENK